MGNIYQPVAQFCAQNTTASDTILASAIGIVGYRCPGFIEDAAALVWPPAKDYGSLWDIAQATKPTYLFLNVDGLTLDQMAREPFASLYRPVQRFDIDGVGNPSRARNRTEDWAQEYILYRRVAGNDRSDADAVATGRGNAIAASDTQPRAAVLSVGVGIRRRNAKVIEARCAEDVLTAIAATGSLIARGNGRSYGDPALNPAATLSLLKSNRFIAFDPATGLLSCEAGVLLEDMIDTFLPRGWFPPVTPGTKFVTVGGMIASNVHGKNHHVAGCFGDHVESKSISPLADGSVVCCSRIENRVALCRDLRRNGADRNPNPSGRGFRLAKVESSF